MGSPSIWRDPTAKPRRPGRKPRGKYGRYAVRKVPERIDETVEMGCSVYCPYCHGPVSLEDKGRQYRVHLPPVQPRTIEFVLPRGRCQRCGRRVQGRQPRQVFDAVRVGRVHLGPGVIGVAASPQTVGGLSYGKITRLLKDLKGLWVARSTLCRALVRLAKKARQAYQGLVERIQGSQVVYPDETGWRIRGRSSWLWAVTSRRETAHAFHQGRGYTEAASIQGQEFADVLMADGWAPSHCFEQARLQTCLAHLLRRCQDMLETATRGAERFPRQVQAHPEHALAQRDRSDADEIGDHGLLAKGRLQASLGHGIRGNFTNPANSRLARHLLRYEKTLFHFLDHPSIEATNWPSEHAIHPAVVNRKSAGGNRSHRGAEIQAVLMSLLRTAHQKDLDPRSLFTAILRAPTSMNSIGRRASIAPCLETMQPPMILPLRRYAERKPVTLALLWQKLLPRGPPGCWTIFPASWCQSS